MTNRPRVSITRHITMAALVVGLLTSWSLAQHVKIAFVTSTTTNGAMGGLAGADAVCNARAAAGGLDTTRGPYRAWLSTSAADDPESTFVQAVVPYVLSDGTTQIAADWNDLVDSTLATAIRRTELGGGLGLPNLDRDTC